jgi:CubicO group peptidase (beta-lactamase class C family)
MSPKISRRKLLKEGAKAAFAASAAASLAVESAARQGRGARPGARRAGGEARGEAAAFARLDEYARSHAREVGAPGMTLAVADGRGLLRALTYGFADTKARAPVRPETLFEIGSISKSFTAVLLLRLREANKLDFGRPVREYLPWLDLRENHGPVTTHHLLTHTAGLQAVPLIPQSLAGTIETYAKPGERFVYSNLGYLILGLVAEAVDGRPFGESLRERVLRPLGMNATAPVITNEARPRMAVGYGPLYDDRPRRWRGPLAEAPWVDVDTAAGSVASTPADMAAYIRMLTGRGRTPTSLLSHEGFDLLTKPAVQAPFRGEEAEYAYGLWVSRDREGHTRLRHTGGMVAFSSSFDVDATAGLGAFASVNASLAGGYRPVAVTKYAVELLRAARAGLRLPDPPASPPDPFEVKNAAEYAGAYATPDGKKALRVEAVGARLFLAHGGRQVALERSGGRDSFVAAHPDFELYRLVFGREGERVVEAGHGPDWYAGERYAGPRRFDHPSEWDAFVGLYRNDSPWYGPARVVLRKGRLWLDGQGLLVPVGPQAFSLGPPERSFERLSFGALKGGRALRMYYSTVEFYRTLL